MARPSRSRRTVVIDPNNLPPELAAKGKAPAAQSDLINAIEFIAQVQTATGNEMETHCAIAYKWAMAFNGLVAIAQPITDELFARPHTINFLASLKRAGGTLAITQQQEEALTMQAGRFKALIPCASFKNWPNVAPDVLQYPCDDGIKKALATVGVLAIENAQTVVEATILLRANSAVATNRHVMFEYWHGVNLPTIVLPKIAAALICKSKKPLVGIGASPQSVTFYFDDNSWIRTQQYAEPWPNIDKVFERVTSDCTAPGPIPEGFFDGLDAMRGFGEDAKVFGLPGMISSHREPEAGATYDVPGLHGPFAINPKYASLVEPWAKQVAFGAEQFAFYGDAVRGLVSLIGLG